MRLDRFLHDVGFGTRKEIDRLIRAGKGMVDGVVAKKGALSIAPTAEVFVEEELVPYEPLQYIMLNKPKGVVSATTDAVDETVLDLLPERFFYMGVAPVGRLDKDTTGLLILSNDGPFAHRLTSPKKNIGKTYIASYTGSLKKDAVARCEVGIELSDFTTAPATLRLLEDGWLELTITEGKFHQVKRMVHALGGEVTSLCRVQIGGLVLDEDLEEGEWRSLTEEEKALLFHQF